jgi:benzylsuccinate CoA-transferase BbsE subunit
MKTNQATQSSAGIRPYSGVRILDCTNRFGAYAGKLFADLGAEVILIEPPGGLPERRAGHEGDEISARFAFFNSGKKSVVIDFSDDGDRRRFDALARTAAVIFVERDGAMFDRITDLRRLNPSAVITAISPFGMSGPLSDAPASDLILQASGGIVWMSGRIEDAPLSLPFEQATMVGSIYAATVTAIAFADAEATGTGHLIDVSVQECIAHSLQNAIQVWDLEQRVSIRGGEGTRDASENIFPCRDGFIFLAAPLALGNSWKSLIAYIRETGHPSGEPLSEERWSNREWRLTREAREEFRRLFIAFTMERTKEELTQEAIARRIVLAPVNRVPDTFDDVQLAHRAFFTKMSLPSGREIAFPGAPYKLAPSVWHTSPAPVLGEHAALLEDQA